LEDLHRLITDRPSPNGHVIPSDLWEHRRTHHFLGPNCLCPVLDQLLPDFVESTIYVPISGPWAGLYMAACTRERCAYPGERLVPEPMHPRLLTHCIGSGLGFVHQVGICYITVLHVPALVFQTPQINPGRTKIYSSCDELLNCSNGHRCGLELQTAGIKLEQRREQSGAYLL